MHEGFIGACSDDVARHRDMVGHGQQVHRLARIEDEMLHERVAEALDRCAFLLPLGGGRVDQLAQAEVAQGKLDRAVNDLRAVQQHDPR